MKKIILVFILIVSMSFAHIYFYGKSFSIKNSLDAETRINYVMPAVFTHFAALDFKGLAADFQLLEAIFFIGDKIQKGERITIDNWKYFKKIIQAVNDLDPYFYDPYYFGAAMLTWGPHMYEDSIDILETARKYRTWDWRILFNEGFIYFYFLKDNQKGAELLSEAAKFKGAPAYYATLSARLSYYSGEYQSGILLLKGMLSETHNEEIRKMYQKRIQALEGAVALEKAVEQFKQKTGRSPNNLEELLTTGMIFQMPVDPYGGKYILLKSGRVYSTSKFSDKN